MKEFFEKGDEVTPDGYVSWLTVGKKYIVQDLDRDRRGQVLIICDDDGDYMSFQAHCIKYWVVTIQRSGRRN